MPRAVVATQWAGRALRPIVAVSAMVSGVALVVVAVDLVDRQESMGTQAFSGLALLAAGFAAGAALWERSTREGPGRHGRTHRWLALAALVLFAMQGAAYLGLAAAGRSATSAVGEAILLVAIPLLMMAVRSMPATPVISPHERRILAGDALVAWLSFLAIVIQAGASSVSQSPSPRFTSLALLALATACAVVVWLIARSRHRGILPARQLALWVLACALYLGVSSHAFTQPPGANPAWGASMFGLVAAGWIAVLVALRSEREVETDSDARLRTLAARVIAVVPPVLLVGLLAYDVGHGVALDETAALLGVAVLAGVVITTIALRLLSEMEFERSNAAGIGLELREGTEQPWFRALVAEGNDMVTLLDLDGWIVYQTPSVARVLGYDPGAWIGHRFRDVVIPESRAALASALSSSARDGVGSCSVELDLTSRHVGILHTETTIASLDGDHAPFSGFVLTTRDVTDRHDLRDQLEHQADTDALTGRANLAALRRRATEALRVADPGEVALVTLDLDRFSSINDSFGHARGDELLVQVGDALARCIRPWDVVARVGGDGFAILVLGTNVDQSIARIQDRARRVLSTLVLSDGRVVPLSASAGYAVNDTGSETAEELLRNADLALSRARVSPGSEITRFQHQMHEALLAQVEAEHELRAAFAAHEFELHFQPIVDLGTGLVLAVEGLARWRHPYRGLVTAGDFIPQVEELGLGGQLCEWVVGQAATAIAALHEACPECDGCPEFRVGVNVSPHELRPELVAVVRRALAAAGAPATGLTVEVTESTFAADAQESRDVLTALRALGVEVAIDDFGTGYASLGMLATFPVDYLKIDRTFVEGMSSSSSGEALVSAVTGLAKALGLRTVAEGVETQLQATLASALGCDRGQGYLFAKAMPLDELLELLTSQRAGRPTEGVGEGV